MTWVLLFAFHLPISATYRKSRDSIERLLYHDTIKDTEARE